MALLLAAAAAAAALSPGPATIAGDWLNQDRTAIVRIAPCSAAQLCGTVVRVLAAGPRVPTSDVHNPDAALRRRPLLGLKVLTGFSGTGSSWSGGRAYDPKTGKSYRASLALTAEAGLKVTGCIAIFCRSQLWTRVR